MISKSITSSVLFIEGKFKNWSFFQILFVYAKTLLWWDIGLSLGPSKCSAGRSKMIRGSHKLRVMLMFLTSEPLIDVGSFTTKDWNFPVKVRHNIFFYFFCDRKRGKLTCSFGVHVINLTVIYPVIYSCNTLMTYVDEFDGFNYANQIFLDYRK